LLLIFILIISFTIFYYEHSFRCDEIINLAYVYIYPGTQCSVHREGLLLNRILSYPKNLKVNDDDTLVNLNVPKNGNDIAIPLSVQY
jgi:hypothetical protein